MEVNKLLKLAWFAKRERNCNISHSNHQCLLKFLNYLFIWKTLNHLEVKPGLALLPPYTEVCLFLQQQSQEKTSGLSMQGHQKAGFTCASTTHACALSVRAIRGPRSATPLGKDCPLLTTAASNTHLCLQQHHSPAPWRGKCSDTLLPKMLLFFRGGGEKPIIKASHRGSKTKTAQVCMKAT